MGIHDACDETETPEGGEPCEPSAVVGTFSAAGTPDTSAASGALGIFCTWGLGLGLEYPGAPGMSEFAESFRDPEATGVFLPTGCTWGCGAEGASVVGLGRSSSGLIPLVDQGSPIDVASGAWLEPSDRRLNDVWVVRAIGEITTWRFFRMSRMTFSFLESSDAAEAAREPDITSDANFHSNCILLVTGLSHEHKILM